MMVRTYGQQPYRVAVIHGGPGAKGSVAPMARQLSRTMGVIEPIQSRYTIAELVEELASQLNAYGKAPLALIGHSWGAWLSILYAARYPEAVSKLILVGCGPLETRYMGEILHRRMSRLTAEEQALYQSAVTGLEQSGGGGQELLNTLGRLSQKADNYELDATGHEEGGVETDARMYAEVWNEAAAMRADGGLLASVRKLVCPVWVIHGQLDPHPVEGVTRPLADCGVSFEEHVLARCGHSPFLEKYARDAFYQILDNALS